MRLILFPGAVANVDTFFSPRMCLPQNGVVFVELSRNRQGKMVPSGSPCGTLTLSTTMLLKKVFGFCIFTLFAQQHISSLELDFGWDLIGHVTVSGSP